MATYTATYKRFNGGGWDVFYFATQATQVLETAGRLWMTPAERAAIAGLATTYVKKSGDTMTGPLTLKDTLLKVSKSGLGGVDLSIDIDSYQVGELLTYRGRLSLGANNSELLIESGGIRVRQGNGNTVALFSGANFLVKPVYMLGDDTNNSFAFTKGGSGSHNVLKLKWGGSGTGALELPGNAVGNYDAVTLQQVLSIAADGLKPMPMLQLATHHTGGGTFSLTLSGTQMVDGINTTNGDRVLVKDFAGADVSKNGVYIAGSGVWEKQDGQSKKGFYGQVQKGVENRGTWWYAETDTSWQLHSQPDEYGAYTDGGLELVGMKFRIKSAGIVSDMIGSNQVKANNILYNTSTFSSSGLDGVLNIKSGGITNDHLAGSIAWSKLADQAPGSSGDVSYTNTTSGTLANHLASLYKKIYNLVSTAGFADTTIATALKLDKRNRTFADIAVTPSGTYIAGDLYFQITGEVTNSN